MSAPVDVLTVLGDMRERLIFRSDEAGRAEQTAAIDAVAELIVAAKYAEKDE